MQPGKGTIEAESVQRTSYLDRYLRGDYARRNPSWSTGDSHFKAQHVAALLKKNGISPSHVGEVGCGAGEILVQLQAELAFPGCQFYGFELQPEAEEQFAQRRTAQISLKVADFFAEPELPAFDVLMLMDVIEHVEDIFSFLRRLREKSTYQVFHIPLDLSAQGILRDVLVEVRNQVGHLHYFTKAMALQTLTDLGYRPMDWFYTSGSIDLPARSWQTQVARLPRKALFRCHQDLAARLLGGFSLMVLTRAK